MNRNLYIVMLRLGIVDDLDFFLMDVFLMCNYGGKHDIEG